MAASTGMYSVLSGHHLNGKERKHTEPDDGQPLTTRAASSRPRSQRMRALDTGGNSVLGLPLYQVIII